MEQYYWEPDGDSETDGESPQTISFSEPWQEWDDIGIRDSPIYDDDHFLDRWCLVFFDDPTGGDDLRAAVIEEIDGESVTDVEDIELWMWFTAHEDRADMRLIGRVTGGTFDEDGYAGGLRAYVDSTELGRYTDGDYSDLGEDSSAYQGNDVYEQRLRIEDDEIKLKVWRSDDPEPDDWTIEASDSNISGTGGYGYFQYNADDHYQHIYALGVGTDGAPAPTSESEVGEIGETKTSTASASASTTESVTPGVYAEGSASASADAADTIYATARRRSLTVSENAEFITGYASPGLRIPFSADAAASTADSIATLRRRFFTATASATTTDRAISDAIPANFPSGSATTAGSAVPNALISAGGAEGTATTDWDVTANVAIGSGVASGVAITGWSVIPGDVVHVRTTDETITFRVATEPTIDWDLVDADDVSFSVAPDGTVHWVMTTEASVRTLVIHEDEITL